ncbi:MAG: phenylalanine--tRNA ligase subunit alpha [Euryarchaeota archaeon]|nr:phenylalanine--tRNA ligase subunit alpha [Euryarchaeota archaeon]
MDFDKIIQELSQNEKKVLLTLKKLNGSASPQELVKQGDFTQVAEVMNAASWLQSKKLVAIEDHITTVYSLGKEGKHFVQNGLPEKRALKYLSEHNGKSSLKDLSQILEQSEISVAVGWLRTKGWVNIKKDKETLLEITDQGKKVLEIESEEEKALNYLDGHPNTTFEKTKLSSLLSRKNVLKEKEQVTSTIVLTEYGKKALEKRIEITEEISQITSALIKTGDWERTAIRPYDIHAFAPALYGGKTHPLVALIGKIRDIFIEMGFQEIEGDYVESCFWDMDVLFIPQDHPAREMQDTFYCKNPKRFPIKEKTLLESIAAVHENGGTTKSTGWGYQFSRTEGEKTLLRTHTTVSTIRYLYDHPQPPCKVFSIGRVFRKENIDTTHLPEFYQIEGIIHEENANFRQLLGILKEFYRRMGFEKIRFRPGYFPYTEPSMEVDVFWNNKWMELGGSGMFRPEVTEPVGVKSPVLAWGLGLERLAMQAFGLKDIRSLYISDLEWLQKTPLR